MFYLTKTNFGAIEATYTGRFSFVKSINGIPSTKIFNSNYISRSDLLEEFNHYEIYRLCPLGLGILSLRWFTRLLFSNFNTQKVVYEYYLIRSAYFSTILEVHEKLVGQAITLNTLYSLLKCELRAFFNLFKICFSCYLLLFVCLFPVHFLFGFILNYHFAFIGSSDGNHLNISYRRYLNSEKSKLNKFTQKLWVEKWSKRPQNNLLWAIIKFKAEKEYLRKTNQSELFPYYVQSISKFIFRWCGGAKNDDEFEETCTFLRNIDRNSSPSSKVTTNKLFWNFFYMHGN